MDNDENMNGIRQAFERMADNVEGVDYALSGPDSCSPVGQSIEILAREIKRLGIGDSELAPLEAIAVSLGGGGVHTAVGPAIERNADANHRIADALESIAQAISEKE